MIAFSGHQTVSADDGVLNDGFVNMQGTLDSQHASCLQEHGVPVLVYILNRPEDWDAALKLGGITAIMTDAPKALGKYLSATQC